MKMNRKSRQGPAGMRASRVPGWPRVRIRVDIGPGCAVGPGKISLLEAVTKVGSLSLAARELGMSYRRAWLLLDELNRAFDEPVATTAVGGVRGGGATVTDRGLELIREYRVLERAVARLAVLKSRNFRRRAA